MIRVSRGWLCTGPFSWPRAAWIPTFFVPEPGNVLYLDYETDGDTAKERAQLIVNGLGIPLPENIFYRYTHQTVAADIEEIQQRVLELGIDFLVGDSATPAVGEPESAQATAEYFRRSAV